MLRNNDGCDVGECVRRLCVCARVTIPFPAIKSVNQATC